jgi:hypothetical protein
MPARSQGKSMHVSNYPLIVRGAMREWRVRSKRLFDLMIDTQDDEIWSADPPKRNAAAVHLSEFEGPASGPMICYRRALATEEDAAALFGGVDDRFFGAPRPPRRIGPVGLDLVGAVDVFRSADVQDLLDKQAKLFLREAPKATFIHAAALLPPDGARATLIHAVASSTQHEELFVWVLTYKGEWEDLPIAYACQHLRDEGLEPIDGLVEYISLPEMHPTGVMEHAFELSIAKGVKWRDRNHG